MNKLALEIQNKDLKIQLANLKNKKDQEIEILEEKIGNLESMLQKMDSKMNDLFSEIRILRNENIELKERNNYLESELSSANETITHLKNIINKDSNNSSKPPSSDGFKKKIHNSRERSGKKTGGQIGHAGKTIMYFDEPTIITRKNPARCECGGVADELVMEARKQIVDVEIKVNVQEEQVYVGHCNQCNKLLKGNFSEGFVNPVQYGNKLKSLVAMLLNEGMVSIGRTINLISEFTNQKLKLSEGTIVNIQNELSKLSQPVMEELKEGLQNARLLHSDETGVRVNGKQCWVHTAANASISFYGLNKSRGKIGMDEMGVLGSYAGILVHDHWKSYFGYPDITHVECNAHVLRYTKEIIETTKRAGAEHFLELLVSLNNRKKAAVSEGSGGLTEDELNQIHKKYRELLAQWQSEFEQATRGKKKKHTSAERCLIARLMEYEDAHLMFLSNFEVPFDNNLAERELRMIKTKTKVSGGFRSLEGGCAFLTIRGLIGTAKKHGCSAFQSICDIFDHTAIRLTK